MSSDFAVSSSANNLNVSGLNLEDEGGSTLKNIFQNALNNAGNQASSLLSARVVESTTPSFLVTLSNCLVNRSEAPSSKLNQEMIRQLKSLLVNSLTKNRVSDADLEKLRFILLGYPSKVLKEGESESDFLQKMGKDLFSRNFSEEEMHFIQLLAQNKREEILEKLPEFSLTNSFKLHFLQLSLFSTKIELAQGILSHIQGVYQEEGKLWLSFYYQKQENWDKAFEVAQTIQDRACQKGVCEFFIENKKLDQAFEIAKKMPPDAGAGLDDDYVYTVCECFIKAGASDYALKLVQMGLIPMSFALESLCGCFVEANALDAASELISCTRDPYAQSNMSKLIESAKKST